MLSDTQVQTDPFIIAQSVAGVHYSSLPPLVAVDLMKLFHFVNVVIRFVLTEPLSPE